MPKTSLLDKVIISALTAANAVMAAGNKLIGKTEDIFETTAYRLEMNNSRRKHDKTGHKWRPGVLKGKPSRYCEPCDLIEDVSVAEFYSLFGRMPW